MPVTRACANEEDTVLLVEDQDAVREVLGAALKRAGYSLLEAANGEDALSVASDHPGKISIVVTDVVMPKLGGPDLYRRLIKMRPGIKVLFMSGYAEEQVRKCGVEGESAFLEKPFSLGHLTRTVRSLTEAVPSS